MANMSPSVTDGTPVTGTTDALGLSKQAFPFREKEVSAILLSAAIMRNNPLVLYSTFWLQSDFRHGCSKMLLFLHAWEDARPVTSR